jgi:hypothetical protein
MSDEPTQEEETLSPSAEAIATDDELTREDVVVADEIAAGAVDETVVPTETAELKLMSPAGEAHADEIYYWPLTVLVRNTLLSSPPHPSNHASARLILAILLRFAARGREVCVPSRPVQQPPPPRLSVWKG